MVTGVHADERRNVKVQYINQDSDGMWYRMRIVIGSDNISDFVNDPRNDAHRIREHHTGYEKTPPLIFILFRVLPIALKKVFLVPLL